LCPANKTSIVIKISGRREKTRGDGTSHIEDGAGIEGKYEGEVVIPGDGLNVAMHYAVCRC